LRLRDVAPSMVPMEDWGRVSGAVIDRRAELGLTQKGLAVRAGVSERTIQNLEAGRRPQPLIRGKIEKALGWEPGEFRRIAEQPQDGPASLIPRSLRREITENEDLTPAEKEAVLAAIETTLRGGEAGSAGPYSGGGERRRTAS